MSTLECVYPTLNMTSKQMIYIFIENFPLKQKLPWHYQVWVYSCLHRRTRGMWSSRRRPWDSRAAWTRSRPRIPGRSSGTADSWRPRRRPRGRPAAALGRWSRRRARSTRRPPAPCWPEPAGQGVFRAIFINFREKNVGVFVGFLRNSLFRIRVNLWVQI